MMSVGLAVLILLTSIDYTVDMHFCQGNLKSYSLFGQAEKCYKGEPSKRQCAAHATDQQKTEISRKACCSNKTLHAKLCQNQVSPQQSSFVKLTLDLAGVIPDLLIFTHLNKAMDRLVESHYKPPLPTGDLHSLLQVFRL